MPSLSVLREGRLIETHELGPDPIIVGRDETADLVLDETTVSRRHLKITPSGAGHRLEDLGTENGVFINGVREWSCEVSDDVTVQLGEAILLYHATSSGRHDPLRKKEPGSMEILLEGKDLPSTSELHPKMLRELQAALRIQTKPHLVLESPRHHASEAQYIALNRPVTTIGYGPVHVSFGAARKATVLAEVHKQGETYELQSKGLLSKVRLKGKRTAKVVLRAGITVEIDGFSVTYRPGVDIGD